MKKRSSIVWRFFDRLEENKRCVGVLCKLCDTQYKFFGNTTNMRSHLTCKHPLQWELIQNGTLDESTLQYGDDTDQSTISVATKRKYKDKNVRYSVSVEPNIGEDSMPQIEIQRVDVLGNYESDGDHQEDNDEGIRVTRQLRSRQQSDEEWLDEEYQPLESTRKRRRMSYKKIKREIESPPRRISHKHNTFIPNSIIYEQPEGLILQDTQKKDEYSVFGEYVANKLRKVKLPKTRGNLQQLITTILWQAEYGMYDTADAVKRVLSFPVHENNETDAKNTKTDQNQIVVEEQMVEQEANQSSEMEEQYIETA